MPLTRDWINEIRKWFRRFLRRSPRQSAPTILERQTFPACSLIRLDRDTAGSIDTWRLVPRQGAHDFLVALDSFRKVRAEIGSEAKFRGQKSGAKARTHTLTPEAQQLLLWQPNRNATHLFWVEKVSRLPVNGRIKMQCVGIWALDLEGFTPAWAGYDRYAQAIVRRAVRAIALLPEPEFSIKVTDADCWLQAVSDAAKAFLGQLHHI